MIIIAFDVDGTLINKNDKPRPAVIGNLIMLSALGNVQIVVWSGSGADYARMWVDRLDLGRYVWQACGKVGAHFVPDITFDDQPVTLGRVNIRV